MAALRGVQSLRSSFGVSLAVHVGLVLLWAVVFRHQVSQHAPRKLTWIEVDPLPKKREDLKNSRRIVQTQKGQKSEQAAPDAFLGEQTQTVDRQTVSKDKITQVGKADPLKGPARPNNKADPKSQKNTLSELAKFGLALPAPKTKNTPDSQPVAGGEGLAQDYVTGMKEGESTALNTKQFVFYSYFQRIRQRLDLAWQSTLKEHLVKLYRGGRQLASDMDHLTRVLVTLNGRGEIVRVQVVEESGVRDLDSAAVKAFNQAGPFPNPPKGMADAEGKIEIRWDFILKS